MITTTATRKIVLFFNIHMTKLTSVFHQTVAHEPTDNDYNEKGNIIKDEFLQ